MHVKKYIGLKRDFKELFGALRPSAVPCKWIVCPGTAQAYGTLASIFFRSSNPIEPCKFVKTEPVLWHSP
jgi:hypothetical protein